MKLYARAEPRSHKNHKTLVFFVKNIQKLPRIALHGLVLIVASDVAIKVNWAISLWSKPDVAVTLLILIVLPIVLFLIWSVLIRFLTFFEILALRSKPELVWIWVFSLLYAPLIFVIYVLQGYAPGTETILGLMLLQMPVNALAVLAASKGILHRVDEETVSRKRPVLSMGCTTLMIITAGLLALSHIPRFMILQGELAVARRQNQQLRTLYKARERWAGVAIREYRLRVDVNSWSDGTTKALVRLGNENRILDIGELAESCAYTIEVEDESVVSMTTNSCLSDPMTVTDFFEDIEQTITRHACGPNGCRCDGFIDIEVEYDPDSGYPQTMKKSRVRENLLSFFFADQFGLLPSGCTLVGWGLVLPEYELRLTPIQ